jgi:hypothetical protein
VTGLYPEDHTEYVSEYSPRSRAETRLACQLFIDIGYKFIEIHPDRAWKFSINKNFGFYLDLIVRFW